MAVGKNKRAGKSKKGSKKKIVDPFTKKEWYTVKAPSIFKKQVGLTLATKSLTSKDNLKGRVFEVSLADLKEQGEEDSYRKIKLRVEDVQGKTCLTNFYGMDFTTDKLRSLVRKWKTLIEAYTDCTTSDGYKVRMFCIGFTKKMPMQVKTTSYAQSSQAKAIRKKMRGIMNREATTCTLIELVQKFISDPESIGKKITKACHGIYPLQDVFIRKCKVLRLPKFDPGRLLELHDNITSTEDVGMKVERPQAEAVTAE